MPLCVCRSVSPAVILKYLRWDPSEYERRWRGGGGALLLTLRRPICDSRCSLVMGVAGQLAALSPATVNGFCHSRHRFMSMGLGIVYACRPQLQLPVILLAILLLLPFASDTPQATAIKRVLWEEDTRDSGAFRVSQMSNEHHRHTSR